MKITKQEIKKLIKMYNLFLKEIQALTKKYEKELYHILQMSL